MAPTGVEPVTFALGVRRSIQLNYGAICPQILQQCPVWGNFATGLVLLMGYSNRVFDGFCK